MFPSLAPFEDRSDIEVAFINSAFLDKISENAYGEEIVFRIASSAANTVLNHLVYPTFLRLSKFVSRWIFPFEISG